MKLLVQLGAARGEGFRRDLEQRQAGPAQMAVRWCSLYGSDWTQKYGQTVELTVGSGTMGYDLTDRKLSDQLLTAVAQLAM